MVIVNERLSRQLWPGERALGRRVQAGFGTSQEMATIVGVVGNVLHDGLTNEPPAELYVSMRQRMAGPMHLVVRGERETPSLPPVRDAVQMIDPNVPIVGLRTMDALVAASVSQQRLVMMLLLVLGALGLALGAIGVYGVVSYTVGQRTREIGVRMALGAEWRSVARLILGGVVRLALAGVAIGGHRDPVAFGSTPQPGVRRDGDRSRDVRCTRRGAPPHRAARRLASGASRDAGRSGGGATGGLTHPGTFRPCQRGAGGLLPLRRCQLSCAALTAC